MFVSSVKIGFSESHSLLSGVNEFLSAYFTFSDLGEICYKRCACNVIENLWVSWKPYFS